jgi:dolichol-phosphate mannosyltransferase
MRVGDWFMELCIVVPTFNEVENVQTVVDKLAAALAGIDWEVVFVDDDSTDGTADVIRSIGYDNPRVRCLQRIGRRGLSSAVIEGILSTCAPYIAVIDGDLQHDETLLPRMLKAIKREQLDIVIGSRYVEGSSIDEWDSIRAKISSIANYLSRLIIKTQLSDPMSGFFMIHRDAFFRAVRRMSGQGFKVLLDLFASSPVALRYKEFPYTFRPRRHGKSKLDSVVILEYLMLLLDKMVGHIVPVRFFLFAAVGGLGLIIHLASLWLVLRFAAAEFIMAQSVATLTAMTFNFYLNNMLTYRDNRLHGSEFFWGLLSFYLVCSVGAITNIGIANFVYHAEEVWWVAGLAGSLVGAVWNYTASSVFTWGKP